MSNSFSNNFSNSGTMFNTLPASPPSTPPAQGEGSSSPQISAMDIRDFISPKLYQELSWDENRSADEVTADCIERAKNLTQTMLHLVQKDLNLFSATQREVVKTLTVYELYLYNGDRYRAKGYMEKAEKLISDRYNNLEKQRQASYPIISVTNPKTKKC